MTDRSAPKQGESELTRRARAVIAGLKPVHREVLDEAMNEGPLADGYMEPRYKRASDELGVLSQEWTGYYNLVGPTDLGRECARLLGLEVGRG